MKHILNIDLTKIKLNKGSILQIIYDDSDNTFTINATKATNKGFEYNQKKCKKTSSFKKLLR